MPKSPTLAQMLAERYLEFRSDVVDFCHENQYDDFSDVEFLMLFDIYRREGGL